MDKNALIVLLVVLMGACASAPEKVHQEDLDFIADIQKGGYVIFFRAAATDPSRQDTDLNNPANCEEQRRLSGLGRTQSKVIGKSFKKLNIPVGDIVTSLYCRSVNTARLAFGRANPTLSLSNVAELTGEKKMLRVESLRDMLASVPKKGSNTVIVGHDGIFKEIAGVSLKEGESAIYKPNGSGDTRLVTRVNPNGWQKVGTNYSKFEVE